MNSQIMPLRYKISNLHQLADCRSNNSKDLIIHVSDFCNSRNLTGLRISVDHKLYGSLFAYVVDAGGSIISDYDEYSELEISLKQLFAQLYKFGFCVIYDPERHISSSQLEYLTTLKSLGYDKLRIMNVYKYAVEGSKQFDTKVVAFQVDPLGDWLNNAYSVSYTDFSEALDKGYAINLTTISKTKNYRWDWLVGKVLSIEDILNDNVDDITSPYDIVDTPEETEG